MARIYTEEEHAFMKSFVPGHTYKEIREEFLKRFGGELAESFPSSYINNHNLNTGLSGRFKKGMTPANKGKKMSPELYAKSAPTMFKPGQMPQNTDLIGTEKLLADGYIWVKIDNQPKVKKTVNWIQKHRKIWQEQNGPIPEGHVIIFLDGDRTNFDIDNLACISKAENARLNQRKLRFDNADLTKSGVEIAKVLNAIGQRKGNKHGNTKRHTGTDMDSHGADSGCEGTGAR